MLQRGSSPQWPPISRPGTRDTRAVPRRSASASRRPPPADAVQVAGGSADVADLPGAFELAHYHLARRYRLHTDAQTLRDYAGGLLFRPTSGRRTRDADGRAPRLRHHIA